MRRGVVSCALTVGSMLLIGGPARAASLSDQLHQFLETNVGISKDESVAVNSKGMPVATPFVDTATPVLQKLEIRGADFPVTSTSPGFTFRYNPELGIYEPATLSLGPVFVERADTLGAGRVDVGANYLFARLTEVQGRSLKGPGGDDLATTFTGLRTLTKNKQGGTIQERVFHTDEFALEQHVLDMSATYGLTDRWDINLLVPIIGTRLVLSGRSRLTRLNKAPSTSEASLDADHEGVGDVQLRTKYLLGEALGVKLASVLSIRPPTGDENNFQGIGDFTVTPSLVASKAVGQSDFHLNVGTELNAQDVSQSRARYALGATLQLGAWANPPLDRAALLVDFIGNSAFFDDQFEFKSEPSSVGLPFAGIRAPSAPPNCGKPTGPATCTQFGFIPRTDILDLATGVKFLILPGRLIAYLGVIYPLNDDGLRAKVIPTGNIEMAF